MSNDLPPMWDERARIEKAERDAGFWADLTPDARVREFMAAMKDSECATPVQVRAECGLRIAQERPIADITLIFKDTGWRGRIGGWLLRVAIAIGGWGSGAD